MQLRDYQLKFENDIFNAWGNGYKNVLGVMPCGGGKCLGKGTPILMFDGSIKLVENIKEGDLLMGPNSRPRIVLSTCRGREPLYRVVPKKGESYIVNESHILSLRKIGGIGLVNIPVRDYLKKSANFKNTHEGWRTSVNYDRRPFITPPYILGVWLGDGSSDDPSICNVDYDVISEWYDYAHSIDCSITVKDAHRVPIYRIKSNNAPKHGCNGFRNFLRNFNLFKNKHIPHIYKTGDKEQRLQLLAGIIDTDGYLSGGGYDLIFKQQTLANDIAYVARSVGLAAYVKQCIKICTNTGSKGVYWRISISGDCSIIPCKVNRRKAPERKINKNVLNVGITLESIGEGDYYGFEIDRDGLFVLGDFTVTHNTPCISSIIKKTRGVKFAIAHRQELVQQISCTLARWGIEHRIIAPDNVIRWISRLHVLQTGNCYYTPNADCIVAGIDTLMSRYDTYAGLLKQCKLWVVDEAHHITNENKWGRVVGSRVVKDKIIELLPNAWGLGVTATALRADGKGLGRHADGVFNHMILGPNMRDLINMGYLCDYRVFNPPSDLILDNVPVSKATGDFNPNQLKIATRKSQIIGDIVQHYLRIAAGKQGVTFATDIETAHDIAQDFRAHNVAAEIVTGKTKAKERVEIFRRFENKEIQQIVNVDIMGEGVDIPAIEVASFGRATESYGLFVQQFGRSMRPTESMEKAIIIDHVGNVTRHGLPDAPRRWSLDRRERCVKGKRDPDVIPVRTCLNVLCMSVYEAIYSHCPYCGTAHIPANRSGPEHVDGDLIELDAETLALMRGEVMKIDTPSPEGSGIIGASIAKNHRLRQEAQELLRHSIKWWAGHHEKENRGVSEIYKRFYFKFGYDMLTAQTLGKVDAKALAIIINKDVDKMVNKR